MDIVVGKNKRSGNITAKQKEVMVEFLKNHFELLRGKFSATFKKTTAQTLWQQLADTLNVMVGSKKEWHQWRKTWHDFRSNVKNKENVVSKYRRGTGGGEPMDEKLSPVEEAVVGLIETIAIEGHPVMESSVVFPFPCNSKVETHQEDVTYIDHNNYYTADDGNLFYIKENVNNDMLTLEIETSPNTTRLLHHETEKKTEALTFCTPRKPKALQAVNSSVNISQKPPPQEKINSRSDTKGAIKPSSSKPRRVVRLDKSIAASGRFAEQNNERISILRNYYERKLQLMEEDICVKQNIARSLQTICQHLNCQ